MSDPDRSPRECRNGFATLLRHRARPITPDVIKLMEEEDDLDRLLRAYGSREAPMEGPADSDADPFRALRDRLAEVRERLA